VNNWASAQIHSISVFETLFSKLQCDWLVTALYFNVSHCIAGEFDWEVNLAVGIETAELKSTNIIFACNAY